MDDKEIEKKKTPAEMSPDIENKHVHEVYEEIAGHFSQTRYKPWPRVDRFLNDQEKYAIGVDLGAGNGKYLGYPHLYTVGGDYSLELTKLALDRATSSTADCVRCDTISTPFSPNRADFVISIAVIHHLCTRERRVAALRSIMDLLNQNGTALVYVWALEQKHSRRGWHDGCAQDVMVPWVLNNKDAKVHQRYYHLYKENELQDEVLCAGGKIIDEGYERDNWWVVCTR